MITIKELADLCDVSIATVSRAMNARADVNPQTRARILKAAEEYGYVPNSAARSLKLPVAKTIAVIVQGQTSELLIRLLGMIDEELEEAEFETLLFHVSDRKANAQTIVNLVTGGSFSGVIFLGRYGQADGANTPELSRSLSLLEIPIAFCTTTDFSNSPSLHASVTVDDIAGATVVTEHLLKLGHRSIAFALFEPTAPTSSGHAWMLRYRGFRQAMERAEAEVRDELLIPGADPGEPYSMSNAHLSTTKWLAQSPTEFTAVVASCDAVGIGVMRALSDAGLRVPEDVSVVGFDGLEFSHYSQPSLTTLVQPLEEIAQRTVDALLRQLAYPYQQPQSVTVDGTLWVGESTAPVAPQTD